MILVEKNRWLDDFRKKTAEVSFAEQRDPSGMECRDDGKQLLANSGFAHLPCNVQPLLPSAKQLIQLLKLL